MDRMLAEEFMGLLQQINGSLNSASQFTERLTDKAERDAIRRPLGTLMEIVYLELMRPITKQYPDLDPDA
jgi:hypothetical protein